MRALSAVARVDAADSRAVAGADSRVVAGAISRAMAGAVPRALTGAMPLVIVAALLGGAGCARLLTRPASPTAPTASAIIAAGAARERALLGARLTLSVRATAGPPAARLASPAYLAVDDPEHLRLQVLSPFGVTVLDLATARDTFTLALPMQGTRKEGRIDLAALAAGATPEDERMIVALALLFRPKMDRARCSGAGRLAVGCAGGAPPAATITVDEALRTRREEYVGPAGTILVADLDEYAGAARAELPGRITVSDGRGGPALVVRVVRVRRIGDSEPTKNRAAGA
jgi:hypothetical protein